VPVRRIRRFLTAIGLAGLGAVGSACGGSASATGIPAPPQSLGTVVDFPVPPSIANIPLTKADGSRTTLAAYRGKAVMIADSLTLCYDVCPMTTADARALANALAAAGNANNVAVLEISVDPRRDTPARMRAYQDLYGGPLPNWTLLRASPANTARLWKYFGVEYSREPEGNPPDIDWWTHKPLTYDVGHADDLIFLDARGRERFVVSAAPNTRGLNTPANLVKHLSPEGKQLLAHPNPVTTWTVSQGLSVFSWLTGHRFHAPS
jgi:protein SCO1/2